MGTGKVAGSNADKGDAFGNVFREHVSVGAGDVLELEKSFRPLSFAVS